MTRNDLKRERTLSENTLTDKAYDFTAKYMAVYYLQSLTESNPEVINSDTISILEKVLLDYEFSHQTQAYFMYKEVANTLCSIIIHSEDLADNALDTLKSLLGATSGHPHRATAEALGALPFSIQGPRITDKADGHIPCVTWEEICKEMDLTRTGPPGFVGRSLVAGVEPEGKLLVVKLARANESLDSLSCESLWMEYLLEQSHHFSVRFNIPEAIKIQESYTFRLRNIPAKGPQDIGLHPRGYAIGFVADEDYFTYPNDASEEKQLTHEEFGEVISRNAWLLGRLASLGIVHAAPVPLFHNRVQRQRRRDQGLYEWARAGRLDRWLDTCLYPNLGVTGVRDFEHLVSFKGKSESLYRHIGIHMLSLLLIVGSYFRNKDRERVGFDKHGRPVDARDLFDRDFLKALIYKLFCNYYSGFVSDEFKGVFPIDLEEFTSRMIDEMGVDRHMEEILRPADQNEMTDEEFKSFLRRRGFSTEKIKSFRKGAGEIVINSGPHLGEFNHSISLPELIEAVGTMSSLCIAGKYCSQGSTLQ
ncbi:MAG: SidJ-related pseudokinase [Deltaproteobacteria bacterium]|nr:SidJ-related pseudokinase [Deltaproteobacteria bacterium]